MFIQYREISCKWCRNIKSIQYKTDLLYIALFNKNTQTLAKKYTSCTGRIDIQILIYMLVMTLFLWILMQLSVNIHFYTSGFK